MLQAKLANIADGLIWYWVGSLEYCRARVNFSNIVEAVEAYASVDSFHAAEKGLDRRELRDKGYISNEVCVQLLVLNLDFGRLMVRYIVAEDGKVTAKPAALPDGFHVPVPV